MKKMGEIRGLYVSSASIGLVMLEKYDLCVSREGNLKIKLKAPRGKNLKPLRMQIL